MNFSVIISVFLEEDPAYFNAALRSIWIEQIPKPDELVLVVDGPVGEGLNDVILEWEKRLLDKIQVVRLTHNIGLGRALDIGLKKCTYDIVARMDSDDISRSDRFFKQINFLKNNPHVDILGSDVLEFNGVSRSTSLRKVPNTHQNIVRFAKKRNPFNHPSIVFKKSVVTKVGGYQKYRFQQDYYLWVRLISNGAICSNISEPLVKMRSDYQMIKRRGGWDYAVNEIILQVRFYQMGFISIFQLFSNLVIRVPARLMPGKLRSMIYKLLRKSKK